MIPGERSAPVLLWGSPRDLPLAAVCTALSRLGTPMFFVDQTRVLDTELSFASDEHCSGWLRVGAQRCELSGVRAAYIRPDAVRLDSVARAGPGSALWRHAADIDDALASWLELTPALVLKCLSAMASNGSKPYQALLIRQAGFQGPDTLLTTDPGALREFQARHPRLIYKSQSGIRSIVARLDASDEARLARLATCPTQFQQYIPGRDYRVHVIGEEVYGHVITSDADDYRYAGASEVTMQPWPVPVPLAERLRGLAAALGLALAGIDLRRSSDSD